MCKPKRGFDFDDEDWEMFLNSPITDSEGSWISPILHSAPKYDERDHVFNAYECWCKPVYDDGIYIHNALDKQDQYCSDH